MNYRALHRKVARITGILLVGLVLSACATKGPPTSSINDPLESANRAIFKFNERIDRYALKPVATGYKKITPSLVRTGVNNFFGNLGDVSTAANGFLQGKFKQGFSDTARFSVNTLLGFGGIIDVATQLEFKKHFEDFGQTLGVWGVPEGPYIMLPFFGPQTLRSTIGLLGDSQIEPLNTINLDRTTRNSLVGLNVINSRSKYLAQSSILETAALDPYQVVKDRFVGWRRKQTFDRQPDEKPATSERELEELDELDLLDELDDLDELDELDELDLLDELDDLDEPLSEEEAELLMLDEMDDLE